MKGRTAVRLAAMLLPVNLLLGLSLSAKANPPEEIVEVASGCFSLEDGSSSLKRVVKLYGDSGYSLQAWGELQIEIEQLLKLKPSPGSASFAERIARDAGPCAASPVHSIVFANPAAKPNEEVARVLYRPSKSPDADNAGLGGTRVLYEVFVSESGLDVLDSTYVVTRKENPLLSKITSFFVKIADVGASALRAADGRAVTKARPRPVSLCVLARRVPIRFSRAKVAIKDFVTRPAWCCSSKAKDKSADLSTDLLNRLGNAHPCAAAQTRVLNAHIQNSGFNRSDILLKGLANDYETALAGLACQGASDAELAEVREVYEEFRALVPSGNVVKGETTYENTPPTRFSLDLILTGAVGGTSANVRAKVDSKTLVEDPFDKPLTAAGVSWYPFPADPMRQDRPLGRPSLFLGATLTPDIGIALGVGLGVVKDLKVTGGYAWLQSSVPRPGYDIGAAIGDKEPLKKGLAGTFFVGLGYAF